ncbi:MAG: thiamine pyrophosphate-dependent enzyme, partial [Phycisphaerae bacterium]|nr:thiamine pyrophosphate-dependent enzyme [Phycisphaerae bacterium]
IVGGNFPVGTGAGLACKMMDKGQVALCFFGDGSSNQGTFHESLNMAGVWKLPVVYVCENNLYGMSVSVERACAVKDVASRASSYDMPGVIVDGQRVLEVKHAVEEAVECARRGEGPMLVEAKTYRYRGHSRSDPRAYRTKEEEAYWHGRDPITLFHDELIVEDILTKESFDKLQTEVDKVLDDAEDFALNQSPYPEPEGVCDDVYVGWVEGKYGLERVG